MGMDLRRTINYQTRIFLLVCLFSWIITFAFLTIQITREREYKVGLLDARLQELNRMIIRDYENGVNIDSSYMKRNMPSHEIRVSLIDLDGKVIYDSNGTDILRNHAERQEVKDAISKGMGYTIRRQSETNSLDYFYSAMRGKSVVVRSSMPYDSVLEGLLSINSLYALLMVLTSIVLTIVAFFASRRLSKSIEMLRDFANCAEHGDIESFEVASFPKGELGDISGTIVKLYKNLKQTAEERDKNLQEAMFEESEKNRIKQQLTNNINHELKTPVHAIQACLETVIEMGDNISESSKKELLDKSYQNAKRLSDLLSDVSVITRMTEAPDKIEFEQFVLKDIVESVADEVADLYPADKYIKFEINVDDNIVINGNVGLIESVFKNLMVNSVLHSGGNRAYLTCSDGHDGYAHITYYDNGKGVPEEHLTKIFERFYRVDKGRSRATGGTGLGLSIVRNAVAFHKGTIVATNRKEGGLRFDFTLRL